MTKHRSTFLILFLFFTIILSGCYSYSEVSKQDYLGKEKHRKTKIILNNKDEVVINQKEILNIIIDSDNIVIIKDSTKTSIPISDIHKIMEQKFDLIKSLFAGFWFSIIGFFALGILFLLAYGFPSSFG